MKKEEDDDWLRRTGNAKVSTKMKEAVLMKMISLNQHCSKIR